MRNITAAVAHRPGGELSLEQVSLEAPRPGELLVRITAVGICHTDAVVQSGSLPVPFPAVFGHEGVGVVEQIGAGVTALAPGDTVVLTFDHCGTCSACRRHAPSHCVAFFPRNFSGLRPDGTVTMSAGDAPVHGSFFGQSSFASHALCGEANAIRVDADLPVHLLAPLGCGIQTGAGAILNSFALPAGATLAVIGVGAVGLAAVMAARAAGAGRIVACDRNPERLALAAELGAADTADTSVRDLGEVLRDSAPGGFDYILDTTGNMMVIAAAIGALAPGGTCGVIGASPSGDAALSFNYRDFLVSAKRVMAIIEGDADPHVFIPRLVAMMKDGTLPLERLVATYPFADINRALDDLNTGRVVKPVLMMDPA